MLKTQDEIIFETEMVTERCRNELSTLKGKISNEYFRACWVRLENALFEFTVLFYTHRSIWTRPEFWSTYASTNDVKKFTEGAYQRMIDCTLVNAYLILYFYVEGALNCYLTQTDKKQSNTRLGFIKMYDMIDKNIHSEEVKNGLEILKYARNSGHGEKGTFIFSLGANETKHLGIIKKSFRDQEYIFEDGKPISVSYKFLRDFIPEICNLYKLLFLRNLGTSIQSTENIDTK